MSAEINVMVVDGRYDKMIRLNPCDPRLKINAPAI
jgi:hypothetical protein